MGLLGHYRGVRGVSGGCRDGRDDDTLNTGETNLRFDDTISIGKRSLDIKAVLKGKFLVKVSNLCYSPSPSLPKHVFILISSLPMIVISRVYFILSLYDFHLIISSHLENVICDQ